MRLGVPPRFQDFILYVRFGWLQVENSLKMFQGSSWWDPCYPNVSKLFYPVLLIIDATSESVILMLRTYAIWERKRTIAFILIALCVVLFLAKCSRIVLTCLMQVTIIPAIIITYIELASLKCPLFLESHIYAF